MERYDRSRFAQQAILQNDSVVFSLPLPHSPAEALSLVNQFSKSFECNLHEPDWGADRLQVSFICQDRQYLFQIEWLCEAIWIEPVGTQDENLTFLWHHITQKQSL